MCPKSRFNIGFCPCKTHMERKGMMRGKVLKFSLFLSDWIISWCQWRGREFSRNLCVSMETRSFNFPFEKSITFISAITKTASWKLFSIDVNCLEKIVVRLFLFMNLLSAAFLVWYSNLTSEPLCVQIPAQSLPLPSISI